MPERFRAPGNLSELSAEGLVAWSDNVVSPIFDDVAALFPGFYNPAVVDTPVNAQAASVRWPAFPGTLLSKRLGEQERWHRADASRDAQDEYCEWSVKRHADGSIQRVTFTTETSGYYEHLLDVAPDLLGELYQQATGQAVNVESLRDSNGFYTPSNPLNFLTDGPIVHLAQDNNTLGAAVRLAGDATVLRERDGKPVVHPQALVSCGGIGVATRHSDPQIAAAVNNLVAQGFDITLANPPGLYLDQFISAGLKTPTGIDAATFWTVERGDASHAVRARFEVPSEQGFTVSDITAGGRPIKFGSQLAERVRVRLDAIAKPGDGVPARQPCVA